MGTILLTGATGFLGSHLLKTLLIKTDNDVIILKRSFSNTWRIKDVIVSKRVKTFDIDKNPIANIDFKNIDTIIHCATEYGRSDNSCFSVLESNLMFPIKLLELAVKNNVKTFINTDSYFNKENMSYSYLLNYSLSKKSLNLWLKYFSKKIQVINMILEHMYGEFDNKDKFAEKMIQEIAILGSKEIALTYGDQKRDFIYIDDVCRAYLAAISYGRNHKFRIKQFDIGTGISSSIKYFVTTIKELSDSNTKLNFGALPYREDEIMYSCADTAELMDSLGISEFCSCEKGISKIINTYIQMGKNADKR